MTQLNMEFSDEKFKKNQAHEELRRVSRKLWTVYETVSCMQQLHEHCASRTYYYVCASL